MQDRRLGARGHALWGAGAGTVLRCCSGWQYVTARCSVLGDLSNAGAGAALGCCWGCCLEVLVTVWAHMDGRVLGQVLFHDAVEPVRTLLLL